MQTATRIAGIVAGVTLTLGTLTTGGAAYAADQQPAACAQQQTQVDRAEDAHRAVAEMSPGTAAFIASTASSARITLGRSFMRTFYLDRARPRT